MYDKDRLVIRRTSKREEPVSVKPSTYIYMYSSLYLILDITDTLE